jgi:hypothetical protein
MTEVNWFRNTNSLSIGSVCLSVSLFPVAPTLEHRASVKRFVTYHFLNPKTVGRTPWTGDKPVARPLPTQKNANTE